MKQSALLFAVLAFAAAACGGEEETDPAPCVTPTGTYQIALIENEDTCGLDETPEPYLDTIPSGACGTEHRIDTKDLEGGRMQMDLALTGTSTGYSGTARLDLERDDGTSCYVKYSLAITRQ